MSKERNEDRCAPKWLLQREGITQRQWKVQKRAELKIVIGALNDLVLGSSFIPKDADEQGARSILNAAEKLKDAMSVKNWGR